MKMVKVIIPSFLLFLQMQANSADSTRLANLRDTLLTKLMSGEIEINKEMRIDV